jgi:hypothetical protein
MNAQLSLKDLESVDNVTASSPEPAGQEGEFDWSDTECVVLPEQPETAVYWNPRGELAIRQRRWPDDDSIIYITRANIDTFLDRLTEICGVPTVGKP